MVLPGTHREEENNTVFVKKYEKSENIEKRPFFRAKRGIFTKNTLSL